MGLPRLNLTQAPAGVTKTLACALLATGPSADSQHQGRQKMAAKPTTIAEYIKAAPAEGQPHLQRLYEILKSVAPDAEEAIKWGVPFFIEPRFVFSFSATKAHLNFAPMAAALEAFQDELAAHKTTQNFLQVPYNKPLPEELIRKIAKRSLQLVSARQDDSFW